MAKAKKQTTHETILASILRATTTVARQAASSEDDVIRAMTDEFHHLGLRGTVVLLLPNGHLLFKTHSLGSKIEKALKKLTGIDLTGHEIDPTNVDLFCEIFSTKQAAFSDDSSEVISQLLPSATASLLPRIIKIIGPGNVIFAPLILSDEPIGAITVTAEWLTHDDVPFISALADHVSIALDHVRNRNAIEAALEIQRLRTQVAELLTSDLDLPSIMERVLHLGEEITGADSGAIALLEPDGKTLTFPYSFGVPEKMKEMPPLGAGLIWITLKERKAMLLEDYSEHQDALQPAVEAGIRALLGVPLIAGDEVLGGMAFFGLSKDIKFTREHLSQMETIAGVAAIAAKNARLFSEAQRRAEESQALIRTAHSISASLDTETVLNEIATQANQLLDCDGSRIHLVDYDTGTVHCVVAREPNAEELLAFEFKVGEGITGGVIERGQPVVINDPAADSTSVQVPGTPEDEPECLAIVPLSIRQRTLGAMTVRRLGLDRPFTNQDLDLLSAFAAQAAVSIENANLFGQIEAQAQLLELQVEERTRELSMSEARYRSLVETAQSGIFQLDLEGRFLYGNQALTTMFETDLKDVIGKRFDTLSFIQPDKLGQILENFHQRTRGKREPTEVFELEFKTPSGRTLPALIGVSLITDDDGNPQGVTGLITDISERIELEDALKAERDRLDAILGHVGDAVMVTDAEASIQFVNPAWERLNNYSFKEALGKNPDIIQSDQHNDAFYSEMQDTIAQGNTWQGEITNRRKDGSTYEAALTITPVLSPTGTIINFVSVYHDISALKEIDRLKSRFVSDVSHELRTPLTNIRLYLDLIARVKDRDKTERYLETLSRESDRLANLIDDLLSLSRIDVGTTQLQRRPMNVNDLLRSLAEDRRSLAAKQGLQLETKISSDLPEIQGDERLLSQVFTNLLTNAMNYTQEGGVISLRTRSDSEASVEWVVVEVEDSGLGIPLDEQSEIFTRFFRGSASKSTGAPGTGLGLAICDEIIHRHGGHITLSSEGKPGKGSCFSVWLPVDDEAIQV
ncbi:MAG: GAF domain-containing protein [Anaerolineales bacterium]